MKSSNYQHLCTERWGESRLLVRLLAVANQMFRSRRSASVKLHPSDLASAAASSWKLDVHLHGARLHSGDEVGDPVWLSMESAGWDPAHGIRRLGPGSQRGDPRSLRASLTMGWIHEIDT